MESIKQEIVNNVYENGEQLITGPVLQEVLLDIVDDYNGKIRSGSVPQDLVGKTGSWDDAADWVEQNSSSVVLQSDLEGYATEDWVEDQGYLKEHQDISGLATTQSLNELSESVAQSIADIPEVDLSGYATTESVETLVNETSESVKEWVEAQRYLTSASLSGSVTEETVGFMINDATQSVKEWVEDKNYATETFVSESIAGLDIPSTEGFATTESLNQLSESVANDFANLDIPDISGLATTESVSNLSESVAETIANLPQADLSGYLTTASYTTDSASFDERINAITGSDLSGYATTESLNSLSESVANDFAGLDIPDISGLATTESVNQLSESVATSFENLPEVDLSGYATTSSVNEATSSVKEWVQEQGYLTEHQDISGLATTESVNSLSQSVAESIENIDLSEYATTSSVESSISEATESVKEWVEAQRYLTTASLSGSVTEESVQYMINDATSSVKDWVESKSYATETFVSESIAAIPGTDLTGYATEAWVQEQGYLTEHQDISGLATTQSVIALSESVATDFSNLDIPDISGLATTESVNSLSESVAQDFENLDIPDVSGLATSESVSALSESVRSLGNQVNGFGEDLDTLNGTVAGLASTSSLNSLSKSVAIDLGLLDERVTEVEDNKVDWDTYDTEKAEFSQSVAGDVADLSASIAAITGSDLSGYATTESVSQLSESVAESIASIQVPDVSGFLPTSSYLVDSASFDQRIDSIVVPDVAGLATTESVNQLSSSFDERINNIVTGSGVDLSGYATTSSVNEATQSVKGWVEEQGYLTEHQDISGLATTQSVNDLSSSVGTISSSFAETIANIPTGSSPDLSGYATTESVNSLSESIASDFANLDIPDVSIYTPTASFNPVSASFNDVSQSYKLLNRFLFGTQSIYDGDDIELSAIYSNWNWEISGSQVFPLASGLGGDGHSIEVFVHNVGTDDVTVSFNREYTYATYTLQSIVNGVVGPGSFTIPAGEYGDIVVTKMDSRLFFRTSLDVEVPEVDLSGYATTASLNSVSESLSASIAAITSSGGGSGTDTDLRNYLFGVATQQVTGITGSVTNIFTSISQDSTLGFSGVPDEGRSLSITILNNAASTSTITLPETVVVGSDTFNLINNGVDGSGSMSIPAGEYGDIVVTRHGSDIYVRTSVNLDDINVDLSGYATTSSLNSVSESLSASIAAITASGGESGDYLPLTGGTLTAGEESDATVLELTAPDGGGGHMTLETSNNPENPDWPGYGGSSLIIGGKDGEIILHDGPYIDYSWKNGEDEFVSATINFPEIDGDGTLVVQEDLTSLSESISQSIANIPAADLSGYATTASVTQLSESVAQSIANISISSGGVWLPGNDGTGAKLSNTLYSISGSVAEGLYSTASGYCSHAEGYGAKATGSYSHAEGYWARAYATASHAEGYNTTALGQDSHAEGSQATASGYGSHAEGFDTWAQGQHSHAEGEHTVARGAGSHAEGLFTIASGSTAHAEGYYTRTSNDYEHAQGRYNATASGQIFSVGVGDSLGSRKNAVSIIVTGSGVVPTFYIYGIGGYNGTNPNPGTNDVVSVIAGLVSRIEALESGSNA